MSNYIISCDPATEDDISYTFVYDWVEIKPDKNTTRMKKIEKILKDYSNE